MTKRYLSELEFVQGGELWVENGHKEGIAAAVTALELGVGAVVLPKALGIVGELFEGWQEAKELREEKQKLLDEAKKQDIRIVQLRDSAEEQRRARVAQLEAEIAERKLEEERLQSNQAKVELAGELLE
eukprot:scaffold1282_cov251-Pinguiococcus_pyrenoidosus.AAC.13